MQEWGMVDAKEELKLELNSLVDSVSTLHALINNLESSKNDGAQFIEFNAKYQQWYTPSLRLVSRLAPDRLGEFKGYYEIDARRKGMWAGTYVIQDYFKGLGLDDVHSAGEETYAALRLNLESQRAILHSLVQRGMDASGVSRRGPCLGRSI